LAHKQVVGEEKNRGVEEIAFGRSRVQPMRCTRQQGKRHGERESGYNMIASKFRRLQARHRVNQFYVFESARPARLPSPRVTSAAQAADGAVAAAESQSDALKRAAGRFEERAGGFPMFWGLQPSAE
jgi:hypothetical protein